MSQKLEDGTEVFTQEEMDAKVAEANSGISANRDKAMDQAKTHKAALDAMTERWGDLDPENVKTLLAEKAALDRKAAEGKGDWDTLEGQLKEAHGVELGKRDAREQKLMKQIERSLVTSKLTTAIAAHKGDADLLLPHARQFVKTRETDEGFDAYVVDAAGNPRFSDGQGTPMTFDQLVEGTLIEKYPRAFEGTGSSGSGASKSAAGGGGSQSTKNIAEGDNAAFLANLEGVATGEVAVR